MAIQPTRFTDRRHQASHGSLGTFRCKAAHVHKKMVEAQLYTMAGTVRQSWTSLHVAKGRREEKKDAAMLLIWCWRLIVMDPTDGMIQYNFTCAAADAKCGVLMFTCQSCPFGQATTQHDGLRSLIHERAFVALWRPRRSIATNTAYLNKPIFEPGRHITRPQRQSPPFRY